VIQGDEVIHELVLPVAPEEAFEMFVDPERLVHWIGISAELEPHPGGRFRFEVMPGQYCEGEYLVVERPHRLVLTWGWTDPQMGVPPGSSRVEITLRPAGASRRTDAGDPPATALRLVHTRLATEARPLHDDGWTRFLERLTAVLERHPPPAYPTETPEERRRWLSTS
jgi:uncharacterized protein YndB with AHSA1/START domain